MSEFSYVTGEDGAKHVNWLQRHGVTVRNQVTVFLYFAGPYGDDKRYNNFGFKHILFPSKKGTDTATKALNRAKRRSDIDANDAAKQYRSGCQREHHLQPSRAHEDALKGQTGYTKYGKALGKNTVNSYVDMGIISFDEFKSTVAERCLAAFKSSSEKELTIAFKLSKAAVCGVSAEGHVEQPRSTFSASVYRQASNAFHIFHFAGDE